MGTNAVSLALNWSVADAESVAVSQRWVLAAMQKHGPSLVRLLWRILGNEQDVCDTYQDVFLRLAHRDDGKVPNDIHAFVFRCATNAAVSVLRARRQQQLAARRMAREQLTTTGAVGREMDEQCLRESLRAHVNRLPEMLRDVVLLKDFAEMPYRQVARTLGISVAAARVYRCRAVRLLSGWMARREANGL